jgi:hypothetical protein
VTAPRHAAEPQLLRSARGPWSRCVFRGRRCQDVHALTRSSRYLLCRDVHALTRSSRSPRAASGPGWAHGRQCRFVQRFSMARIRPAIPVGSRGRRRLAEHAACHAKSPMANVHQVGPSSTASGSSELVKAHTSRRGRPSCRNTWSCRAAGPGQAWPHAREGQSGRPTG